jgi:hypothetical protein
MSWSQYHVHVQEVVGGVAVALHDEDCNTVAAHVSNGPDYEKTVNLGTVVHAASRHVQERKARVRSPL